MVPRALPRQSLLRRAQAALECSALAGIAVAGRVGGLPPSQAGEEGHVAKARHGTVNEEAVVRPELLPRRPAARHLAHHQPTDRHLLQMGDFVLSLLSQRDTKVVEHDHRLVKLGLGGAPLGALGGEGFRELRNLLLKRGRDGASVHARRQHALPLRHAHKQAAVAEATRRAAQERLVAHKRGVPGQPAPRQLALEEASHSQALQVQDAPLARLLRFHLYGEARLDQTPHIWVSGRPWGDGTEGAREDGRGS